MKLLHALVVENGSGICKADFAGNDVLSFPLLLEDLIIKKPWLVAIE